MQRNRWYMTDEEIRKNWKRAQDKRAQIGILAELNARPKEDVIEKLKELGEEIPEFRKAKSKLTEHDDRIIWRMRTDGAVFSKISLALEGHPIENTIRMRFNVMRDEFRRAAPVIEKAIRRFIEEDRCSEDEKTLLNRILRRGL